MGEQSAHKLRGKAMEDIIFNGSEARGPVGMAEVSLTFVNDDGQVPLQFSSYPEIVVTRRLFRDGESEYLINKTPVRLRDVVDLFLGTGVGSKAYSIIEQGRIGLVVSAKPEDRRHLIEEAAGITKYKHLRAGGRAQDGRDPAEPAAPLRPRRRDGAAARLAPAPGPEGRALQEVQGRDEGPRSVGPRPQAPRHPGRAAGGDRAARRGARPPGRRPDRPRATRDRSRALAPRGGARRSAGCRGCSRRSPSSTTASS